MALTNTWVELDLGVLGANIAGVKRVLGPGTEAMFVVKSNAYGHGLAPVVRCAWEHGVRWYAVSHLAEALDVRSLLPDAEILVVGALAADEVPSAVEAGLVVALVDEDHARRLAAAARDIGPLRCHAKVDTGMGRLGFAWEDAAEKIHDLASDRVLAMEGLCTHLASSDAPDRTFADTQVRRFGGVVAACRAQGLGSLFLHASNSGGILRDAAWDMNGVRPGILIYGYGTYVDDGGTGAGCRVDTRPFLQWKTRVLQVKKVPQGFPVSYDSTFVSGSATHIATIDAGYSDGYSRRLSNSGAVLIGGRRCPVAGRVTMNLVTVDVGSGGDVRAGDEVVLLGEQGDASLWADELARWCDTIPYEILTGIRTDLRVTR